MQVPVPLPRISLNLWVNTFPLPNLLLPLPFLSQLFVTPAFQLLRPKIYVLPWLFFPSHPFPIFQKILLALPSKSTNNQDTSHHPPLPPCSKPPSPLPRVSAIASFSLLPSLSPASILRTAGWTARVPSSFRVGAKVLTVAYKVWHDLSLSPHYFFGLISYSLLCSHGFHHNGLSYSLNMPGTHLS